MSTSGEQIHLSRRKLIAITGTVGAGAIVAGGIYSQNQPHPLNVVIKSPASSDRVLVIATLYGGNDAINTVIPFEDPTYQSSRGPLALTTSEVSPLGAQGLYLNGAMVNTLSLWKEKKVAIIPGVGYPNPNLSHFVSMDIWQSGSTDNNTSTGWIGRYLDEITNTDPMTALSVGSSVPPLCVGATTQASAVASPLASPDPFASYGSAYLDMVTSKELNGVGQLSAQASSTLLKLNRDILALGEISQNPGTKVSPTTISGQLATVADLLNSGTPTKIFTVSQSGFDTHANEKGTQFEDLKIFDSAISGFLSTLHPKIADNVVVVAYSEFGRRVQVNASGGTDHGTAGVVFVYGNSVKGGLAGEYPSLTNLSDGNLKITVDYRSIYATLLENVLSHDSKTILNGNYPKLNIIKT